MARITVTIKNWDAYKGRKDVEHNSWFRCSNRLLEDPDFFDWSSDEILAWLYVMSIASQKNSGEVAINLLHAERVCRIKQSVMRSAIAKLEGLGVISSESQESDADVTSTLRARYADVTSTCATDRQTDITNKTNKHSDALAPVRERFDRAFAEYPLRVKGGKALERFREQIRTDADFEALLRSLSNYRSMLAHPEHAWRKPKQSFEAYLGTRASGFFWKDWVDWTPDSSLHRDAPTELDKIKARLRAQGKLDEHSPGGAP